MRVFCAGDSSSACEPARRAGPRIPEENLQPLFATPVETVGRQHISWPSISSGSRKDLKDSRMRKTFLPFSPPSIGEDEIAEVVDTLRSDWITTGPKVKRFEQEFAAAVDSPAALALSSCTAALHLALVSLGIGPGDAV